MSTISVRRLGAFPNPLEKKLKEPQDDAVLENVAGSGEPLARDRDRSAPIGIPGIKSTSGEPDRGVSD